MIRYLSWKNAHALQLFRFIRFAGAILSICFSLCRVLNYTLTFSVVMFLLDFFFFNSIGSYSIFLARKFTKEQIQTGKMLCFLFIRFLVVYIYVFIIVYVWCSLQKFTRLMIFLRILLFRSIRLAIGFN